MDYCTLAGAGGAQKESSGQLGHGRGEENFSAKRQPNALYSSSPQLGRDKPILRVLLASQAAMELINSLLITTSHEQEGLTGQKLRLDGRSPQ